MQLTYLGTTVQLPEQFEWPDEFGWQPVVQRKEWGVDGALFLDAGTRLAGREITLRGGPDRAWMRRDTLESIAAWAEVAGAVLTLQLRGANHSVVFDHERGAIEFEPAHPFVDPAPDDECIVTLRFIVI